MDVELIAASLSGVASRKADALLVLLQEGTVVKEPQWLAQPLLRGDVETKAGSLLPAYGLEGVASPRVVLAGVGDGRPKQVHAALAAAWSSCKGASVRTLQVVFAAVPTESQLRALVSAVFEQTYSYVTTKPSAKARQLTKLRIVVPAAADVQALRQVLVRQVAICRGIEEAKEWANRPGNHATPSVLAEAAMRLSGGAIRCKVLGPTEVAKLGMGAFQAVAQGSAQPLRFIVLEYRGGAKDEAPVVLVGKGITFDSGGISLKPAAEMDEMKFDMCGAASVLGTFRALSILKPAVNVVGLIASCENLPGGSAVKPGDVVTTLNGQTVEILNTDAEGRLVLCDALSYAERFKPRAVIDIATLTGACVVALGAVRSGYFASDDALASAIEAAAETAQDPVWRLPLDEEYAEGLRSNFADVANVAGRAAGAVTAAKFLQRFAASFAWAHLDIAGTAWKSGAAKGATGRPVGLLVEYVLAQDRSQDRPARAPRKAATASAGKAGVKATARSKAGTQARGTRAGR